MTADWNRGVGVELGLEDGYRLWSRIYDTEYNPLIAVEKRAVLRLLEGLSFTEVLDAGAGTGRWSLEIAARGAQVTALDGSPDMLALAEAKARERGLELRFDHGSLEALPYPAASFDLVMCALVFSHLEDFSPALAEFARVLRPGGSLILTDFHPDIVRAGGRAEFAIDGRRYLLPNPSHDRDDYIRGLERAGLDVVEATDIPLADLPSEEVKSLFRNLFGERDLCLIVLARKPDA